jgi:hypothetical protein
MNTQENNIPMFIDVLNDFENGTLDMTKAARKCYLNEKEKLLNRPTWIHNEELKNQSILRKIGTGNSRDLLKNTKLL